MFVSDADHPVAKVISGKWGDDYPAVRLVGTSSLDEKAEAYMDQITYGEIPKEEAKANARLIAAAPDLLEAAKQAMRVWPYQMRGSTLEAAIAKAEGR